MARRHSFPLVAPATNVPSGGGAAVALALAPALTPRGHLVLVATPGAPPVQADLAARVQRAFARGPGHGLLHLGAGELGTALPPALAWLRELGARFVTAACTRPDVDAHPADVQPPPAEELEALARSAPPMAGAEYLTADVVRALWNEAGLALAAETAAAGTGVQEHLRRLNPDWNVVGRVHLHLAENRRDAEAPFAFLATYTTGLAAHGKPLHVPLGRALEEYAGASRKAELLSLLQPVQRAAERCAWLRQLIDAGELFHPLRWSVDEAYALLRDVPELERAGVIVRMPAGWRGGRPPRPQATATVGAKASGDLAAEALLDFRMEVTLDGEALTRAEVEALLARSGSLALLRGKWVEVDGERLGRVMERFRAAERLAAEGGLTLAEAMRALAGADVAGDDSPGAGAAALADRDWSQVVAGPWLARLLRELRTPEALAALAPGRDLRATLRPYQEVGVRWLHLVSRLGLGACLADDMGLGKTIQVLALLAIAKRGRAAGESPRRWASLLVAPASLLANWTAELERFAPGLEVLVAHPSVMPARELRALDADRLAAPDLVITSYGSLLRLPQLAATATGWDLVVLDEAQAIRNPAAKQTKAAKALGGRARIALTGTPIENRLGDLWSIFDFLNPGLLGSARQFTRYTRRLAEAPGGFAPLRELVRPYILRRLKTDPGVAPDLPGKVEVKAFCGLTRRQAALYQQAVDELRDGLERSDGIERKGLVLASLMRLKQVCNHPSQWLGDGDWAEADSGKWARLRELAEVIAEKQEKALVFTQFREMTAPLAGFLGGVFGRPGLVLHGEVAVRRRADLVRRFQEDESVPFFVITLKAGGSGLNLTAASHVLHVDRWWNPAVEDQATDRAYRIGQTRNVLVHKFVCRGTVEERIDRLIESKRSLSRDLLAGADEARLTELPDAELLRLVALDLKSALRD